MNKYYPLALAALRDKHLNLSGKSYDDAAQLISRSSTWWYAIPKLFSNKDYANEDLELATMRAHMGRKHELLAEEIWQEFLAVTKGKADLQLPKDPPGNYVPPKDSKSVH